VIFNDEKTRIILVGRWISEPAEIVGSNPTGGMDVCLLWVSCVVK